MGVQVVKLLDKLNPTIVTGGLVPRGAYSGATTYAVGDSVSYSSSSYVAIASTTGNLPTDTTKWMVLASQGATGSAGAAGATGATGPPGGGDVVGPSGAADGALALFDGITGKQLRGNANVFVADDGSMSIRGLIVTSTDGTIGIMSTSDGLDMATNSTGLGNVNFSVPTFTPMLGLDEVIDSHITAEQLYAGGSAIFMDAADHKVKVHVNGNTTPQTIAYTTDLRSRSVNSISTPTTAGATANTDYIYLVSGTTTLTLPTAVGNTNRYTVKNTGSATVTIATTSSQTIDGSSTASLPVQYTSLDLISDGSNWNVI